MKRIVLSWSSGKDSAWALHVLRQQPDVEVVALLTTFNEAADRVAMHAVRRRLVRRQALAAGVPLWEVALPSPCPNEAYERAMTNAIERARSEEVTHCAFGDLFLEDIRRYREKQLSGTGIEPLFPLWQVDTRELALTLLRGGVEAHLTCVDPKQVPSELAGRRYDRALLDALPPSADPCGENGEFHTFVNAGPMFEERIDVAVGERLDRDGFTYCDIHEA